MQSKLTVKTFEQYVAEFYPSLNEAELTKNGFLGILGSADSQNLGEQVAPKIGVKTNTIYTVTINGQKDLLSIGNAKTFQNFAGMQEEGPSKPKEDYISITSDGETKEIKPGVATKGNVTVTFGPSSQIKIKASNNGMLAFLRACTAMAKVSGPTGFSKDPWNGKMIISLGNQPSGDSSRDSAYLAVNPNVGGTNPLRYTDIYKEFIDKFNVKGGLLQAINESSFFANAGFVFEADEQAEKLENQIKVVADTMADAIRAAHYYYSHEGRSGANKFSAYNGFNEAVTTYRATVGKEDWKNSSLENRSAFMLAIILQPIIKALGSYYPMNYKQIDLVPQCKEILRTIGKENPSAKYLNKSRDVIKEILNNYKPTAYAKIPAFDPVLSEFWDSISNALVNRCAMTFTSNVNEPTKGTTPAGPGKTGGGEQSEIKKNVSGGV